MRNSSLAAVHVQLMQLYPPSAGTLHADMRSEVYLMNVAQFMNTVTTIGLRLRSTESSTCNKRYLVSPRLQNASRRRYFSSSVSIVKR